MIMEALFNLSSNNDIWINPVKRVPTNSHDEETFVNEMACELLNSNKNHILNMTFKIINREIAKRPRSDLRRKILIQNQIYSNMIDNVSNMVLNLAKNFYDDYIKENEIVEYTLSKDPFKDTSKDISKEIIVDTVVEEAVVEDIDYVRIID